MENVVSKDRANDFSWEEYLDEAGSKYSDHLPYKMICVEEYTDGKKLIVPSKALTVIEGDSTNASLSTENT